jgi:hypothetical protein
MSNGILILPLGAISDHNDSVVFKDFIYDNFYLIS